MTRFTTHCFSLLTALAITAVVMIPTIDVPPAYSYAQTELA